MRFFKMRSLVTEIILGLAIIWNAANAQVSANKLVERRLGTEVLFHHNSQGSMSGDEEEHRQNACSCRRCRQRFSSHSRRLFQQAQDLSTVIRIGAPQPIGPEGKFAEQ
jgi:hypothetical protein